MRGCSNGSYFFRAKRVRRVLQMRGWLIRFHSLAPVFPNVARDAPKRGRNSGLTGCLPSASSLGAAVGDGYGAAAGNGGSVDMSADM